MTERDRLRDEFVDALAHEAAKRHELGPQVSYVKIKARALLESESRPVPGVQIRGTHHYQFRSGEWGDLVGVEWMNGRACYHVKFPPKERLSTEDWWVIDDKSEKYEFREKEPAAAPAPHVPCTCLEAPQKEGHESACPHSGTTKTLAGASEEQRDAVEILEAVRRILILVHRQYAGDSENHPYVNVKPEEYSTWGATLASAIASIRAEREESAARLAEEKRFCGLETERAVMWMKEARAANAKIERALGMLKIHADALASPGSCMACEAVRILRGGTEGSAE